MCIDEMLNVTDGVIAIFASELELVFIIALHLFTW